ncbi:glycosyltransferase [Klebsiella indica]|uniref:glycosyltransferase n=1 Tax=Klebsiella TaxID=570 RepID=UPI003753A60E
MEKILCIHQSSELYGSDRSFFSAVEGINNERSVDVILPFYGDLSQLLENAGINVIYYNKGILRKNDLKKPFSFLINSIKAIFFYKNIFDRYDTIYINTIVMFSAIMVSSLYRFTKKKKIYCHVREIPSSKQLSIFKLLFVIAGVRLIYNSLATKKAFNLPGEVVYNGVSDLLLEDKYFPGSDNKIIKILLIGRINTWKGHHLLINALTNLKLKLKDDFSFNIRIVGSVFEGYENLQTELVGKVNDNGLTENITFFSFTKNPIEHFQWADYIIVPSTKPEPFGRVAIEAFSAARPVIAADHGGLSEIVSDSVNGFLFEPNNIESLQAALMKTVECSQEKYLLLSQNARREYEKTFSEEKYQNSLKKIILGETK